MLRTRGREVVVGLLAGALVAGCSAAPDPSLESASLRACTVHVEQRTGHVFSEAEPAWRMTSRPEGDGFVVNIWTATAMDASRPSGVPNHVCVTGSDAEADDGVRLLPTRP